jgi:MFS family permease
MKKWLPVIVLSFASFVMVLDSTVMNVSISKLVVDLNTSVAGIQIAITFYTLVMAAFMLTGGKLGDILGRLKAFKYGLLIYGTGSLITAFSVGLPMLLVGWSLIEGLGAILVVPAIAALTAANYKGRDRVVAYSILGGISGAAAAAGPLIGGAVTTYLSWRYVFASETVIVLLIFFLFANKIQDVALERKATLDFSSVALSALGLFFIVFAILQTKVWGWVRPLSAPMINGHAITPFGLSVVPFLIALGVWLLWIFAQRQEKLKLAGRDPLLDIAMIKIPHVQAGLANIAIQYLLTAGLFFVIPIYLQMVLGLNALDTGIKILPMSAALIVASLVGAKLVSRATPKQIIVWGKWFLVLGMFTLLYAIDPQLKSAAFIFGMIFVGAGLGFMASQIGNVILSAVDESKTSEAGGLQGTFQNLGSSLGTALIGSVLIASLTTGFVTTATAANSTLPASVQTYITDNSTKGIAVVSQSDVYNYSISKGLSTGEADTISSYYLNSQLEALKVSMLALTLLALLALLGLLFSKNLPDEIVEK